MTANRKTSKMFTVDETPSGISTKATTYIGIFKRNIEQLQQQKESLSRLGSRDTMYRFYSKDTEKLKRQPTPGYQGADSVCLYYQKFKRLDKELETDDNGYSASTAYLSKVRSLKMLPSPLGLIHNKDMSGNLKEQIQVDNLKLGTNYGLALSSSMKHLASTQVLYMPGNRLGQKGGGAILGSLSERMRNINLDNNQIGHDGLAHLITWIDHMNIRCQLEELSLQANMITDQLVCELTESLTRTSTPLKSLNLAHNQLTDKAASALADFVTGHYHLRVLKVSWNQIKAKGGIALAEALRDNQRLVLFDGSFNQFGIKRNGEFGKAMAEAVNKGVLRHLDISYNSIN